MQVPNQLNLLRAYSGSKCRNYSRNSVEKFPQLWQKFNLNSRIGKYVKISEVVETR